MAETIGAIIVNAFIAYAPDALFDFIVANAAIIYPAIGATVLAAASLGLSLLLAPSTTPANGQFNVTQAVPFRRRVYGRAKLGGYYVFIESTSGNLYALTALAAHEIDAIEENWLGDRRVVVDGTTHVVTSVNYPPGADTNQFGDHVFLYNSTGAAGKTNYAALTAAFSQWSSSHVGIGIADVLTVQKSVKQSFFSSTYPGGPQPYRAVLRGAKILDPRSLATPAAWSDNAIAVLYDYLTSEDGWRIDPSFFNTGTGLPITQISCNIADQLVPLKDGGTEHRYRIWGFYDFNEEPRTVLARMLAACGGWLEPQKDGTIGIRAGAWIAPTVTLSDAHILSYDVQRYVNEFDAINEVRATFTYPDNDYQQSDATPWDDDADITRRGYIKSTTLDARHCPSYQQTRRIQKIGFHEVSPEWTVNLVMDAYGLLARNQRFVNLVMDELGLSITCRVTSFSFSIGSGTCAISLASFGADAYDWDPATEEGDAPPIPPITTTAGSIELPTDFAATVELTTVAGSVQGAQIVFSCDAPTDRNDLSAKFEYQIAGAGADVWTALSPGTNSYTAGTNYIPDGTYNARASFLGPNNQQSAPFVTIMGIIVSTAGAAPSPPVNIAVHGAPSPPTMAIVTFNAPNSTRFYAARVWRHNTNVFTGATDISGPLYGIANQAYTYTDTPGAGTWYYWATAENSASPPAQSSPDGPVSQTI